METGRTKELILRMVFGKEGRKEGRNDEFFERVTTYEDTQPETRFTVI